MNQLERLNRRVAHEMFDWTSRSKVDPLGNKITHWYNSEGKYIGYQYPPCNPAGNISESFGLLARHNWTLHTCDAGYRCTIHAAPERGEALLGDGVGDSPMVAICIAALEANRRQHT